MPMLKMWRYRSGHDWSQMIREAKIMQLQKLFAEMAPTSQIPFLNMFDKGFLAGQLNGQKALQPKFAKGNKSF